MADNNTQVVAQVPVTSGWTSKINITQVVQIVATILVVTTGGKINLTPEQQVMLVGAIVLVGNIATVVFKQYFTKSITPQSVTESTPTAIVAK